MVPVWNPDAMILLSAFHSMMGVKFADLCGGRRTWEVEQRSYWSIIEFLQSLYSVLSHQGHHSQVTLG